jgi:hypothetical protein
MLDNRWLLIRLDAMGLSDAVANDVEVMNAPTLSEATQQYLQLKGISRPKTFHGDTIPTGLSDGLAPTIILA